MKQLRLRSLCLFFSLAVIAAFADPAPQEQRMSSADLADRTQELLKGNQQGSDLDQDGIADSVDRCGETDLTATVVIGDCDTGVSNITRSDGCSINDRVAVLASTAENHTQFVQGVAALVRELGLPGADQARLVACAVQSMPAPASITFINGFRSILTVGPPVPGGDEDGDGVLNQDDPCPVSDVFAFIAIGDCVTSVANLVDEFGCTINDQIFDFFLASSTSNQFVSLVSDYVDSLVDMGVYTSAEAAEIIGCASQYGFNPDLDPDSDADLDGVINGEDACPWSVTANIVLLDGCFTGVTNQLLDSGCTFTDLILAEADATTDVQVFLDAVTDLTGQWVADGLISTADATSILDCAANYQLPIDFDEPGDDGGGDDGGGDDDGDGVGNDDDQCPNSDTSPILIIDGCDTGVPNLVLDDGCTLADVIAELAASATNQGDFVSAVSDFTNDLKADGLISGQQKGAIVSCAAQSDLPNGGGDDGSGDNGGDDGSGDDGSGDDGSGDDGSDDCPEDSTISIDADPCNNEDPVDGGEDPVIENPSTGRGEGNGNGGSGDDGSDDGNANGRDNDSGSGDEGSGNDGSGDSRFGDGGSDDGSTGDDGEEQIIEDPNNGRGQGKTNPNQGPVFSDWDGDGVSDDRDLFPRSDLTDVVLIDGCDSGVANLVLAGGYSLNDLIDTFATLSGSHVEFVAAVNHLVTRLESKWVLSAKDAGLIRACAGRAALARGETFGSPALDGDGDGLADRVDPWPNTRAVATIRSDRATTDVVNLVLSNGLSMMDQIQWLETVSPSSDAFGAGLETLTSAWTARGVISAAERGEILAAFEVRAD